MALIPVCFKTHGFKTNVVATPCLRQSVTPEIICFTELRFCPITFRIVLTKIRKRPALALVTTESFSEFFLCPKTYIILASITTLKMLRFR